MLKTSKDLMEWFGLKVGDKIRINDKEDIYIVKLNEYDEPICQDEYTKIKFPMTYLINRKVEILPRPKRVGDKFCIEMECKQCPLRSIACDKDVIDIEDYDLYSILDGYLKRELDQEIYDLLKARLDKEIKQDEN